MIKNGVKILLFATAYMLLFSLSAFAQIKVEATLDSNTILIGQQTKLHLKFTYNANQGDVNVLWPSVNDTIIKQIEVISKTKIDTTIPDKQNNPYLLEQSQTLTITSFDSGYYAIPPFKFYINGDTSKPYETEALLLEVYSVAVDTTIAIRDIKPPIEEPFDFRELLPYVYWGLGIAAVLTVLIYLLVKYLEKRKVKPAIKETPKQPAHIIALEALEKLKNEKLWQEGKIKQYYSSLSEILRNYIELRFKIHALEQTTDEILLQFRTIVIDNESKNKLKQLLLLADLVKFAKEQPIANENEMAITLALDFVNGTKRKEIAEINKEELKPNTGV